MRMRKGSPSVSSLCFYSAAARCSLWQRRIMRREQGKYQRGEEEGRKEGRKEKKQ